MVIEYNLIRNDGVSIILIIEFCFSPHHRAVEECKKKWKTLRIQQRRLLIKKIRKKGKFHGAQWNCYEQLKFLIPHMDWTSAEESSIEKEASGINLTDTDREDDDERHPEIISDEEHMVEAPVEPVEQSTTTVMAAPIDLKTEDCTETTITELEPPVTEQIVYSHTPYQQVIQPNPIAASKNQTLSQFVLTYVPNPPSHKSTHEDSTVDSTATMTTSYAGGSKASSTRTIDAQILQPVTNPINLSTTTIPSYQVVSTIDRMPPHRSGVKESTAPVVDTLNAGNLNYFLLDVAQQMSKLNDIAQIEVKIDIHKLLLEKLRDVKNLQNS